MCKLLLAQEEYLAIEKVDWLRETREENQGAKQSGYDSPRWRGPRNKISDCQM